MDRKLSRILVTCALIIFISIQLLQLRQVNLPNKRINYNTFDDLKVLDRTAGAGKVAGDIKSQRLSRNTRTAAPIQLNGNNYHASANTKPKRKAVVIYSRYRSGSSFLGEFFNQHPSVYYLFEPLHAINVTHHNSSLLISTVLKGLLSCNYDRISEIYRESVDDNSAKCKSNLCFFDRSKFLWRNTDLCGVPYPKCLVKSFDTQTLTKVCQRSSVSAAKVTRVRSLADLVPTLQDESLSVKVIQLIRDPRVVVPSLRKMLKDWTRPSASYARALCDKYYRDWEYFKRCIQETGDHSIILDSVSSEKCDEEIRQLWNNNFLRVSHEYISENPVEAMKTIYDFVDINTDSGVFEWLSSTTNAKANDKAKFYGTVRNSSDVLTQWRLKSTFSDVEEIQNQCADIMLRLGYIPAMTEKHLTNISESLYTIRNGLYIPKMQR